MKIFQSDQCTQAILFYNKSISYCPHPTYDQFLQGAEQPEQEKVKEVQFADDLKDQKNKKIPSKYESLALSYGNRSGEVPQGKYLKIPQNIVIFSHENISRQVGCSEEAEPVRGLPERHREGGQVRLPQGQHLQVVGAQGSHEYFVMKW